MAYITADRIVVEFPIYDLAHRSLKNRVLGATTGGLVASARHVTVIRAIDQISFDIQKGMRIGLVGHNGSGKTTLLRVLAGIYEPVAGQVRVEGKVASLLDVSTGIDPEATGSENIVLRGVMMGLTLREIRSRAQEIAEFTELGEYLDMPVRTYSSGMLLRLAFGVATSINADIVLMDEWLSVGDENFKEKAARRLDDMVARSAILVLASHSMELLKRNCNQVFRMEHGRIVDVFEPQ
jgi:lipopolysaccharide transport system ATP-binding protein